MGCFLSSLCDFRPRSERFREHYVLGRKIGEGAFSVVRRATHKETNKVFAVKCYRKTRLTARDAQDIHYEVSILKQMHHPNIINLYAFYDEPEFYYMVMDLVEGGELFDQLLEKVHYSEKEARDVIKVVLQAIAYCHNLGIVHRDLKPDNILLTSRHGDGRSIKIADFGFAKQLVDNHDSLLSSCGTPEYIAPEIVYNVYHRTHKVPYGTAVDIWAIGVMTFFLVSGVTPFHSSNQSIMLRKIAQADYKFLSPYWDDVSAEAKAFVGRMLTVDAKDRATATELLQDPWIIGHDVPADPLPEVLRRIQARHRLKMAISTVHTSVIIDSSSRRRRSFVARSQPPSPISSNATQSLS
ncbi:CAMK protein kinase [Aphanomyces invadans]|uniref:non-specific serine/threonine protein kinase n=1 Tax=Aphanomyces invadans TaxID=157072 RepID=A0A024UV98_9STRA|nr:CAMK protein kinase [Aphanomyces invadans]ETW10416.1 CAMK protein kinase [Aphanomyces invadans]|eukprot:XP_008861827.1 CAMK protein kinase [Aphanomyces invadans]